MQFVSALRAIRYPFGTEVTLRRTQREQSRVNSCDFFFALLSTLNTSFRQMSAGALTLTAEDTRVTCTDPGRCYLQGLLLLRAEMKATVKNGRATSRFARSHCSPSCCVFFFPNTKDALYLLGEGYPCMSGRPVRILTAVGGFFTYRTRLGFSDEIKGSRMQCNWHEICWLLERAQSTGRTRERHFAVSHNAVSRNTSRFKRRTRFGISV